MWSLAAAEHFFLLVRFGLMSACVWLAVNCGPGPTIPAQPQTSFGLVSQESVAGAVRHDIELPPERPRPTDRGRAAHPPDQGLGGKRPGATSDYSRVPQKSETQKDYPMQER